jgi:hypothetical protein
MRWVPTSLAIALVLGARAQAQPAPPAQPPSAAPAPVDPAAKAPVPADPAAKPPAPAAPAVPQPATSPAPPPAVVPGPEPTVAPEPAPEVVAQPAPELTPPPAPAPAPQQADAELAPPATKTAFEPLGPLAAPRPVSEVEPALRADSLYVRMGAGFGFPFGPDVADDYRALSGSEDLRFSGHGFAMELMVGSHVLPWLAIGAGASSDVVLGGTVRNASDDERKLERGLYYAVVGGFADAYTSPPAGLHFQALVGLARLSPTYDLGRDTAVGFGAVLGVGYDLAVAERWNVGVLGRLSLSPLSMDPVRGEERSPSLYEPSLLFTATFRPEA